MPLLTMSDPERPAQPPARSSSVSDSELLTVEAAQRRMVALCTPLAVTELVELGAAQGRISAVDIISPIDVPAHDNSAMDGFAFSAAELEVGGEIALREVGTALAGTSSKTRLARGECMRIMTGAVLPEGADTVVPMELTTRALQGVIIPAGQRAGQHRRQRGEDLKAGSTAVPKGRRLGPAEVGLLASLGIEHVPVVRRLRVAVLSTGDEVRALGEPLGRGQIYDSNRYTLAAMLRRLDVELIDLGVAADDPVALEAALRRGCREADALVTSGGVSVGEADFTRTLLARLGDVAFWKIAMKPGRPLAFGTLADDGRQAVLFGLPGNPVAAMVTFCVLVKEALARLAGEVPRPMARLTLRSAEDLPKKPGRTEFLRGIAYPGEAGWQVRLTGEQGSGILRSMSEANCLIVLAHAQGPVAKGEFVEALPLDGLL
jgi:molybdopterin molybdotransferase